MLLIIFINKMDYSLVKKNPLIDTAPPKSTVNRFPSTQPQLSPSKLPSLKQTPSPSRPLANNFQGTSTLPKNYQDHPESTEQYTPLTISRSQLLSAHTPQDVDQLIVEHRCEIETLLLQIGRLQAEVRQAHALRQFQVRKAKDQFEQSAYLQISQIRQNQQGQAEVFELQIRKLKDQLNDKSEDLNRLETLLQREKQSNEREKERFNQEVRHLIDKKNTEICELKQEKEGKLREMEDETNNQIEQIRYTCNKQLANLNKMLEQQQSELTKFKSYSEIQENQKKRQIEYLQTERNNIERRYEQRFVEQSQKYQNIRINFNQLINQFNEDSQKSRNELQKIFEAEYSQLISLLKTKENDQNQLRKQIQTSRLAASIQKATLMDQNEHLKNKIKELSLNSLAETELLKVKLATLHQTDLTQLKQLYDMKLRHTNNSLSRLDDENLKLREFISVLSAEKYQVKKRYQITISELNSKIMKMRMGISNLESQFKEKLENQKSLMVLTSRSFLKEAEAKTTTHKFLEEEIRKLRQLMDLQGRQNQNIEKALEEKILAANDELQRLSNKVLMVAKEKQQLEIAMEDLRSSKDQQISNLKADLQQIDLPEGGIPPQFRIIEELKQQLNQKKQQIGILKDTVTSLESRMREMRAQTQRLQMQNNISSQQLKKEFQSVAEKNLLEFKKYYQQKFERVEEEKGQLKKIVSSQHQKITELIKKYKQTEEDLKQAVKMMKKRTELEQKVINIGMDCNLVKNMAQLLPSNKS